MAATNRTTITPTNFVTVNGDKYTGYIGAATASPVGIPLSYAKCQSGDLLTGLTVNNGVSENGIMSIYCTPMSDLNNTKFSPTKIDMPNYTVHGEANPTTYQCPAGAAVTPLAVFTLSDNGYNFLESTALTCAKPGDPDATALQILGSPQGAGPPAIISLPSSVAGGDYWFTTGLGQNSTNELNAYYPTTQLIYTGENFNPVAKTSHEYLVYIFLFIILVVIAYSIYFIVCKTATHQDAAKKDQ